MPISRRQFFRGFLGPGEPGEKERQEHIAALEAYLRSDLLPYDFTLDTRQTAQLFAEIRTRIALVKDEGPHSAKVRALRDSLHASMIQTWREAHWKAEEIRQAAAGFITEFLATEATPEDLEQLRHRFNIPYPTVVEEEVQRQAQLWIDNLSDSRILEHDATSVRNLVFSELRSWC